MTTIKDKTKYRARAMFRGEAFYVEVEYRKDHHDWLKVQDVPRDLRCFLKPWGCTLNSAECYTMTGAKALAKGMSRSRRTEKAR